MSEINEQKILLRERFKKYRGYLNEQEKSDIDNSIATNFLCLQEYVKAKTVLTFVSLDAEIDTYNIIFASLANGKKVACPRCNDETDEIDFFYIENKDDLQKGKYGIMEPMLGCRKVYSFEDSICVVPGLGFDMSGYRIGYGKGYYDRFLKNYSEKKIGLCYSACAKLALPRDKHDVPVDILVTEKYVRSMEKK